MRALVTGGTGFIGAEVTRLLVGRGVSVTAFDINPNPARLDDSAGQVELLRGDLGTFSHVLNAVKATQPDVLYHLGGMLSVPSDADPWAAMHANALGTFHVLEAARLFDVPQVIFSSTLATFGADIEDDVIDDLTLQRPELFYGATKVFGELMGRYYRRKHGLDFRAVRYPSIVGPGVTTPGVAQFTSWMIEESARGRPFTVNVAPETRIPVLYFKDSARAIVQLADAPRERIQTLAYLVAGPTPSASAGELADLVRQRLPAAQISFQPDEELQRILSGAIRPIDDTRAQREWGWEPAYDQQRIVDDFLDELERHPGRYGGG